MKEGEVVLSPLPQAGGIVKIRPSIVLREMPRYRDLLVCGVSTQLHQHVEDFDEIISPDDADFASSGLSTTSLIRLGFLGLIARKDLVGRIGVISPERHQRLLKKLSNYLVG